MLTLRARISVRPSALTIAALMMLAACADSSSRPRPIRSFRVVPAPSASRAPWGIAVDDTGRVVVSELFGNRIDVFSSTGTLLANWGSAGAADGQFHDPKNLDVDDDGNIYVADNLNHRIQKFSSTGAFVTAFGAYGLGDGQFNGPTGIAVDSARSIVYVADSNNSRIQTFDLDGNYLSQWGSRGTGNGQFRFVDDVADTQGPEGDIAIDAVGNLYVVDNFNQRVQYFSPEGTYLGQFGSAGSGDSQFLYPSGITVAPDGNVVVTDASQAHNEPFTVGKIKLFDPSGAFLAELVFLPESNGGSVSPLGVDTDAEGLIYVVMGESIEVYAAPTPSP